MHDASISEFDLQFVKANKWLFFVFFLTFRFIQIFDNFEVKYLPLPESYNNNLIPRYNPLLRF